MPLNTFWLAAAILAGVRGCGVDDPQQGRVVEHPAQIRDESNISIDITFVFPMTHGCLVNPEGFRYLLLGYAASLQAQSRPGIGVSGDHALGNIQHVDLQPAPALFLEPGGGF